MNKDYVWKGFSVRASSAEDPENQGRSLGRRRIIMVVDDEPEVRNGLRVVIPPEYEIVAFDSGEDFLENVAVYHPDLILLDVKLGEHDGFELCRLLRSRRGLRQIPVLFLTGMNEDAGFLRTLEVNGDAYLMKPFDPKELLDTIERLLQSAW